MRERARLTAIPGPLAAYRLPEREWDVLFTCAACGADHDAAELSFGAEAPLQWEMLTRAERARSYLTGDQCEIQTDSESSYYLRACLEIPIQGNSECFTWGVWCSLSAASFAAVNEHWNDPLRDRMAPCFGWLCTRIPGYPDTMYLKTMVHQRPPGTRPWVELEPGPHPLAVDQRHGIEPAKLRELVTRLLHGED